MNMRNRTIFDRQTKKILLGMLFLISTMLLSGCTESLEKLHDANQQQMNNEELVTILCDGEYVTNVKQETIIVPGLTTEYKFVYVADLHIIVPNEEVSQEHIETVNSRYDEMARNINGHASKDVYEKLIENINRADIDGLLLGGY